MPQPSTGCGLARSHRHSSAHAVITASSALPQPEATLSSCVLSNLLLFRLLLATKWPLRPWCWPCMRSHFGDCTSACPVPRRPPMVIPAQVVPAFITPSLNPSSCLSPCPWPRQSRWCNPSLCPSHSPNRSPSPNRNPCPRRLPAPIQPGHRAHRHAGSRANRPRHPNTCANGGPGQHRRRCACGHRHAIEQRGILEQLPVQATPPSADAWASKAKSCCVFLSMRKASRSKFKSNNQAALTAWTRRPLMPFGAEDPLS